MYDIAIMYHYVCPPDQWKGSAPSSPKRFDEQVIYFEKRLLENDSRRKFYMMVSPYHRWISLDNLLIWMK